MTKVIESIFFNLDELNQAIERCEINPGGIISINKEILHSSIGSGNIPDPIYRVFHLFNDGLL